MSNLNLKFSEEPLTDDESQNIAKVYQKVFATPPWNEAYRCPSSECSAEYGEEEKPANKICVCGTPVVDFYDLEDLRKEIKDISQRTGFRIATALSEDKRPVGFWYGWEGDLKTLNQQKLDLGELDFQRLQKEMKEIETSRWFYIAEFGLDPVTRGQGMGKKLCKYGMENIPKQPMILRTNTASPAYYIFDKCGFSTVWEYADDSFRVLMSK